MNWLVHYAPKGAILTQPGPDPKRPGLLTFADKPQRCEAPTSWDAALQTGLGWHHPMEAVLRVFPYVGDEPDLTRWEDFRLNREPDGTLYQAGLIKLAVPWTLVHGTIHLDLELAE